MSIVPRLCKVQKNTVLPELFKLKFISLQFASDQQLKATYELVKAKDEKEIHQKVHNMTRYSSQFVNGFHVHDKVLRMDDMLVTPTTLHKVINNRLHDYRHGRSNMFTAVKDIWFSYFNRKTAVMAENCRNLLQRVMNSDLYVHGKIYVYFRDQGSQIKYSI